MYDEGEELSDNAISTGEDFFKDKISSFVIDVIVMTNI